MKIIYFGVISFIVVIAGTLLFSVLFPTSVPDSTGSLVTHDRVQDFFRERVVTQGAQDLGQPIEGFDASMLIKAYPALIAADFKGVETQEGHYEVVGDNTLFIRDQVEPITSAERTVSKKGYQTLLGNVSTRLKLPIESTDDIDVIILQMSNGKSTDEVIRVSLNTLGEVLQVKITPLQLLEDSRCPIDVSCIQAGTVRVRTLLSSGLGEAPQIFELNQTITTEAEEVTLIQVDPLNREGIDIADEEYVFTFKVEKR